MKKCVVVAEMNDPYYSGTREEKEKFNILGKGEPSWIACLI